MSEQKIETTTQLVSDPNSSASSIAVGSKRRKVKSDPHATLEQLLDQHPPDKCRFYLKQKHRLCAFPITPPSDQYCLHHTSESESGRELCPYCHTPIRTDQEKRNKQRVRRREDDKDVTNKNGATNSTIIASSTTTASSSIDESTAHSSNPARRPTTMEAHQLICPKRLADLESTKLPFYEANVNGIWRQESTTASVTPAEDDERENEESLDHLPVSTSISSLCDVPREELMNLIERLRVIGSRFFITPTYLDEVDALMTTESPASTTSTPLSQNSSQRHQLQHVGFFRLLREHQLLRRGSLVIEVGAGKAGLSGYLAEMDDHKEATSTSNDTTASNEQANKKRKLTNDSTSINTSSTNSSPYTLVVLDRGSFKHKTDTAIRRSNRCTLKRYRIDLQDVRLERMEEVQQAQSQRSHLSTMERPLTMILGKHVCGQATDFVCKAVVRANQPTEQLDTQTASNPTPTSSSRLIDTIAIATCCHHLCVWENYVNQAFMIGLGLTPRDFHLMTRMSTWRTCGFKPHTATGNPDENKMADINDSTSTSSTATSAAASNIPDSLLSFTPLPLTFSERIHIGAICKYLFDFGRVEYLRTNGSFSQTHGRLPYTTSHITKENFCILLA